MADPDTSLHSYHRRQSTVSGAAQVLAKSCKMIPVMVMGTLIGGVYYSSLEYVCALMLAAGIGLFAHQSSPSIAQKLANPNAPLGYFLCCVNLVFDGYTNAAQVGIPTLQCRSSNGARPVHLHLMFAK